MWQQLILVFCFGGLGSVCRYLLSILLPTKSFSWGVLVSNFLGCLVMGFILQLMATKQINDTTKLAIAVGFCGGFTTFSSFSADVVLLFQQQKWAVGFGYVLASVAVGLFSILFGMYLGKQL